MCLHCFEPLTIYVIGGEMTKKSLKRPTWSKVCIGQGILQQVIKVDIILGSELLKKNTYKDNLLTGVLIQTLMIS